MIIKFTTPEGAAVKEYLELQIAADVESLKNPHLDLIDTQFIRGRVAMAEDLLALAGDNAP